MGSFTDLLQGFNRKYCDISFHKTIMSSQFFHKIFFLWVAIELNDIIASIFLKHVIKYNNILDMYNFLGFGTQQPGMF